MRITRENADTMGIIILHDLQLMRLTIGKIQNIEKMVVKSNPHNIYRKERCEPVCLYGVCELHIFNTPASWFTSNM
jgi:hypothetical protein